MQKSTWNILILIVYCNIQHTFWGLAQKACRKTYYVFVALTLHMSIYKRRIQWTFVIASMTSNKFFARSDNFHSVIILGYGNSYNISLYIALRFYEFHVISIRKKTQVLLSNLVIKQYFLFHFRIWTLFILNVQVVVIFWI